MLRKTLSALLCLFVSLVFTPTLFAEEKIPECKDGFGHSGIDHLIIFYEITNPESKDICRGDAAPDFVHGVDNVRSYSIPDILKNSKADVSFGVFAGFVIEQNNKLFLVVDVITVKKLHDGTFVGWKVLYDHGSGRELVRRFTPLTEEEVWRILHGALYTLVVRIDSRATGVKISKKEFDLFISPYRSYISSTTNIQCSQQETV